jgi:hypothetical protein
MIDDFRKQADDSSFFTEEDTDEYRARQRTAPPQYFLGMTPAQRFVIAVMILIMSCILSAFCLLVTERIVPPFLF